jgi:hypothetical protein
MGWDTTRRLKLFPKNGILESIDIESILESINSTVRSMSEQIIFSANTNEGCYEVSWNSSKLSGEFDINTETTIAWDLASFEEGPTLIGRVTSKDFDSVRYEPALFAFDAIRIIGDSKKLETFYDTYLPKWKYLAKHNQFFIENNNSTIIVNGYYTAGNQFELGDKNRRIKLKETINRESNNSNLHYDLGEIYQIFEEVFETNFRINDFVKFTQENEYSNPYAGFDKLEFYFKNRIVKILEWYQWENNLTNQKGQLWRSKTADYWDNCVNINYREFMQTIKEKADNT